MSNPRRRVILEPKQRSKGGRPEGSLAKVTREAREEAQRTGLLPHEILLSMARGEPQAEFVYNELTQEVTKRLVTLDIDQRKDAAKAAAPYYAPKISTVEVITGVPDAELDAIIAQLAAEAGIGASVSGEGTEGEEAEG